MYAIWRKKAGAFSSVSQSGGGVAEFLPIKLWPAAGFVDTEIRCLTELESGNAETEVQPRVHA